MPLTVSFTGLEGTTCDASVSTEIRRALGEPFGKDTQGSNSLPKSISVLWATCLATLLLGLVIAAWGRHRHLTQTAWDPFSDPLLGDLLEYPATYQLLHQAAFFDNAPPCALPRSMFSAVAYPPFAAAILAPLYRNVSPVWGFLCAAVAWVAVALWKARQLLLRHGMPTLDSNLFLLTLLLSSFPLARLVHQGNVELVLWIFAASGTWAFLQGKDFTAASLWALAGAMKLYPLLLLILFLPRRKPTALFMGVALALAASWVSLWWIGPTVWIAWKGSLRNVLGYQDLRAAEWSLRELAANHSWFGWAKLLAEVLRLAPQRMLLPYGTCGMILLIWALRRLWAMPVANHLLAVYAFMLAFPPISYFHTLVHLYTPLLLLICFAFHAQRNGIVVRGLQRTLLLFVPLFAPYTLLLYPPALLFSGLIQSLTLLLLFFCALTVPFGQYDPVSTDEISRSAEREFGGDLDENSKSSSVEFCP